MTHQRFSVGVGRPRGDARLPVFSNDIEEVIRKHDLSFFIVCDFPTIGRPQFNENIIATNWPHDLLRLNETGNLLLDERLIENLKTSIMPFLLNHSPFRSDENLCELVSVYVCERFKDTVAISLYDSKRQHHAIILSGPNPVDRSKLPCLVLELMEAFDRYGRTSENLQLLTMRETECLSWSAAGKSTDETALILDLSFHTVNTYLKTAMQKLEAVTRTQAVATAVRLGLIR